MSVDLDSRPTSDVVALVGLMGTGKSTVASLVAARTGRERIDLDEVVERRAGRSIADIFESDGEQAFRAEETAALVEALSSARPTVLATGGGVVTTSEARDLLRRGARVVWLDAPVDVLVERVGTGEGRPLLGDDPRRALDDLDRARRQLYAEVAAVTVDASADPDEVADRVLAALEVPA